MTVFFRPVVVEFGFLGVDTDKPDAENIDHDKCKRLSPQQKGWRRRRQAGHPTIEHLKSYHRVDRCGLKGAMRDSPQSISCAGSYNLGLLTRDAPSPP